MSKKLLLVPMLVGLTTLPSCMQSVQQAFHARTDAHLESIPTTPVANGRSDAIGRYIARDTERLSLARLDNTPYLADRE